MGCLGGKILLLTRDNFEQRKKVKVKISLLGMTKDLTKTLVFLVVGVVIIGGVFYFQKNGGIGSGSENALSIQEVADKAINYINENIPETTASLIGMEEENGLYKLTLKIGENEFISYAAKNGKLLFPQYIDLEPEVEPEEILPESPTSAIPDVKLFVMSYCPYGLQAQKALLPAWELLKNKANIGIYFVDYIMHEKKEIDDNIRQYCIQKNQPEKIISYLECFVVDGDYEKCLNQTGIDQEMISSCTASADQEFKITENYDDKDSWLSGTYPKFNIHADLNEQYGIGGSPTLVINGQIVNPSQRSPEAFKQSICQAFTNAPEECNQELSNENASPGLGAETGNSSSGGSCE